MYLQCCTRMVSLAYDERLLAARISYVHFQLFPKTSYIRERTQIIHYNNGLLLGLTDHFYNAGDDMEILTEIYCDAKGLPLFNFSRNEGNLFKRLNFRISKINKTTNIERHINGSLQFCLRFIEYNEKNYLIIPKNDATYHKFERILNPLTIDDL